ncbi:hypothetical protein EUGRSUZ_C02253 [Eucalyptus grandis]|uniref:Uncharacterized protein n=2 Tax=Eucalyptus grandis TaxID=71139 RepID=A0ACC3LFA1_EUCGR|nr:hypothetical protein EUGRSUZ_C02253 [Eucalyptus grandis]
MVINLRNELLISSFKTINGRGANVQKTGLGCLIIMTSPTSSSTMCTFTTASLLGMPRSGLAPLKLPRGEDQAVTISVLASSKIWIDHCFLSDCTDGLIDVTEGSTAVTISSNMFTHHDKVMRLGHSDDFTANSGMQVTVAFNHFGEELKESMPRCRFGYFHVVNNDYTRWKIYAVGGSSNPTVNSQGNQYFAPQDDNNKEVTKRMDTDESEWRKWNWRSEDMSPLYAEASSMSFPSASYINHLTATAGVFVVQRSDAGTVTNPSSGGGIVTNPAAPGSSGGTVRNPVPSGGDGSSCYPGQGSTGTVTGTGGWYPDNGIDFGSIFNSEARTPLSQ